jgi:hypothetical protein
MAAEGERAVGSEGAHHEVVGVGAPLSSHHGAVPGALDGFCPGRLGAGAADRSCREEELLDRALARQGAWPVDDPEPSGRRIEQGAGACGVDPDALDLQRARPRRERGAQGGEAAAGLGAEDGRRGDQPLARAVVKRERHAPAGRVRVGQEDAGEGGAGRARTDDRHPELVQ